MRIKFDGRINTINNIETAIDIFIQLENEGNEYPCLEECFIYESDDLSCLAIYRQDEDMLNIRQVYEHYDKHELN